MRPYEQYRLVALRRGRLNLLKMSEVGRDGVRRIDSAHRLRARAPSRLSVEEIYPSWLTVTRQGYARPSRGAIGPDAAKQVLGAESSVEGEAIGAEGSPSRAEAAENGPPFRKSVGVLGCSDSRSARAGPRRGLLDGDPSDRPRRIGRRRPIRKRLRPTP